MLKIYYHIISKLLTITLIVFSLQFKAQLLFYQNAYKGGIAADGRSYLGMDYNLADTINFAQVVPAGSSIKKSWLFTMRFISWSNYPATVNNPINVNFNGDTITFDSSSVITPLTNCDNSANSDHLWLCVKDVTPSTQNSSNKLIIPCQSCGSQFAPFVYVGFFLVIIYEDAGMPITNCAIFLNNKTFTTTMTHSFNNLNPINNAKDVGLSIWSDNAYYKSDSITYSLFPGGFFLGILGETQGTANARGRLLPGSFYYQNNTLFGLQDDSPNPFIDTTDALANVKTYLSNNATSFSVLTTMKTSSACLNIINSHILAYSTPCPARSITPTLTFTLCSGQSLQLQGAGGTGSTYTWYPGGSLTHSMQ